MVLRLMRSSSASGRRDGQRLAGAQPAGSGGVADLVGQLEINRLAGLEIDLKDHSCLTVIQHYDSSLRRVKCKMK